METTIRLLPFHATAHSYPNYPRQVVASVDGEADDAARACQPGARNELPILGQRTPRQRHSITDTGLCASHLIEVPS